MKTIPVQLALIEEHAIIRKAFVNLLHSLPGCSVVIEAASGQDLIHKMGLPQTKPDICIIGMHAGSANNGDDHSG